MSKHVGDSKNGIQREGGAYIKKEKVLNKISNAVS